MFWAPFVVVGEGGTPTDVLAARPDGEAANDDEPESVLVEPEDEPKRASSNQDR
jgi:hypothetical protein